jgi:hypothetical protein
MSTLFNRAISTSIGMDAKGDWSSVCMRFQCSLRGPHHRVVCIDGTGDVEPLMAAWVSQWRIAITLVVQGCKD